MVTSLIVPHALVIGTGGKRNLPALLIHKRLLQDSELGRLVKYRLHESLVAAQLLSNA